MANPDTLADFSLQPYLLFSFPSQSKHKKDTSITHPILLDEPDFEVHHFPSLLFFFFTCVSSATCLWSSHLVTGSFVLHFSFSFFFFSDEPEPLSVYHPTTDELSASMGTPMEGFFDGANVVFGTPASTAPTAAQGVPIEAPIPSTRPIPIGKGTHTEKVSKATPIPTETLTPQEGVIPPSATQTEVASPTTPLIISTSDPFATLSQAVKDGSSLVVTPSSTLSSAMRGPKANLFSEGSEDVLKDPNDEPTKKKRISDPDEEESVNSETEFMGMPFSLSLFFC